MILRGEKTRIVAGCLATMLFSAGAAFAQSRRELTCGNLPGVSPEPTTTFSDTVPMALRPDGANGSYFRLELVPLRPETPCAVRTTEETPSTEAPAEAQPAVAALQPPGPVQNVRRADRR